MIDFAFELFALFLFLVSSICGAALLLYGCYSLSIPKFDRFVQMMCFTSGTVLLGFPVVITVMN